MARCGLRLNFSNTKVSNTTMYWMFITLKVDSHGQRFYKNNGTKASQDFLIITANAKNTLIWKPASSKSSLLTFC